MEHFEVRNERIEQNLRDVGREIAATLPPDWGFCLFIFTYGEKGSMFFISNAEREGMLKALEEFIERQRKGG